eukprot:NODE_512_length_6656_cov_0.587006.p6 type:complete len:120 gc:universal NODE_512_length_6656_cov_0.587006:426-785(+)
MTVNVGLVSNLQFVLQELVAQQAVGVAPLMLIAKHLANINVMVNHRVETLQHQHLFEAMADVERDSETRFAEMEIVVLLVVGVERPTYIAKPNVLHNAHLLHQLRQNAQLLLTWLWDYK